MGKECRAPQNGFAVVQHPQRAAKARDPVWHVLGRGEDRRAADGVAPFLPGLAPPGRHWALARDLDSWTRPR